MTGRIDPVRVALRVEGRHDSGFVPGPTPELSWTVVADESSSWLQDEARIRLIGADGRELDTASVEGRASVRVPWPFPALLPRARVSVQVRVRGRDRRESGWSAPVALRAGFLGDTEWCAPMIGLADPMGPAQPALLRAEFDVDRPVRSAVLSSAARGVYQVAVNGDDVDDHRMKPGWTSYQWRLVHETTEVAELLRPGRNAIGIRLAGGWFTEEYGFRAETERFYGSQPAVALQLEIEHVDGSRSRIATGPAWRASADGPLRRSGIYLGEEYDARRAMPGWSAPGFDDSGWAPVLVPSVAAPRPEARIAPPVRRVEEIRVARVLTAPSGATILDFGQNLVGHIRLTVSGPAGAEVVLRHAEVLEHGELGTRPLRRAVQTDRYRLAGEEQETWEPEFTFHGFRYVEVGGWPGPLDPDAFTAVVVHSDLRRTGRFECSDPLLERLHENVVWGMRGNFLSIPTDCPQRDERMGWTGDIRAFAPTAAFLYDVDGFLASWLRDLALEQQADRGVVPVVVPNPIPRFRRAVAAWGDAATAVPMTLYERFADLATLRSSYPGMRAWIQAVRRAVDPETLLWDSGFQFGDWLDPDAPPDEPGLAKTPAPVVATAEFFRSALLTARTARILGLAGDAERFGRLAVQVAAAFRDAYLASDGRLSSDAPTAYALAIEYGIVTEPETLRGLGGRLAELVRANGYRIGTGFVGTPILLDALCRTGHVDTAARLLLQTERPSWLYPVTMGATTIWERWDSMLEDGSINPGEMTSFNHYAFGAVADWLHRSLAGLAPAEPGYRTLSLAPTPIAGLSHAAARLDTPYGPASCGWRRMDAESVMVEALVPPNATALVALPDGRDRFEIGSGRHAWTVHAVSVSSHAAPMG